MTLLQGYLSPIATFSRSFFVFGGEESWRLEYDAMRCRWAVFVWVPGGMLIGRKGGFSLIFWGDDDELGTRESRS